MISPQDLVGIEEIAALARVSTSAVVNWQRRHSDFPKPVASLAGGPVFNVGEVASWLSRRSGDRHMDEKKTCFVISTIGEELAPMGSEQRLRWERSMEVWAKLIEPACVAKGVEAIRADQIARSGEIPVQIFQLLRDSEIVIADVTDGNPNVMYELGMRHTLRRHTIQIGEYEKLPFDIAAIRTIQFLRTPAGIVDGRKKLEMALDAALNGDPDLVTATKIWNAASFAPFLTTTASIADVPSISVEEPGVFELLASMESAFPELVELSQRATTAMEQLAALAVASTAETHRSDAAKAGFAGRLRIANKMASDLVPIADQFEETATGFEDRISRVDLGMACLLDIFENDPAQFADSGEFPSQIENLVEAVRITNERQLELANSIANVGKFSKPLRISTRRIADTARRIAKSLATAEIWNARLKRIEEKARSLGHVPTAQ
jgi:hypothetical protein